MKNRAVCDWKEEDVIFHLWRPLTGACAAYLEKDLFFIGSFELGKKCRDVSGSVCSAQCWKIWVINKVCAEMVLEWALCIGWLRMRVVLDWWKARIPLYKGKGSTQVTIIGA